MPGYTLWGKRKGPQYDLSTVTVLQIASMDPIPGGVLMCDGIWELRVAMSPSAKAEQRNERKRQAIQEIADARGLVVETLTKSRTWAEMEGLL